MKIIPAGHSIVTEKGTQLPGIPFEIDDAEAKYLIGIGAAKAFDAKINTEAVAAEKKAKEAEELAKARKALEEKALELKVGDVQVIAALSDNDLKAKIASALGGESGSFFDKIFNKDK